MSTNFLNEPLDSENWISQAEAARLHGVSRQAISKLIRTGRLKTFEIGGHVLVSREEILAFRPLSAGRPSIAAMNPVDPISKLLDTLDLETRKQVFQRLRSEFIPLHPLETELNATSEIIMDAIHRAGPLTLRGIRGVLAESAFEFNVVKRLSGWESLPIVGDPAYDFLLKKDEESAVKVQVKLQRKKGNRAMTANEGNRRLSPQMVTVETQRTRRGRNQEGEDTRPYRFGEFDILAVATEPSTGRWDTFLYTIGAWLVPRPKHEHLLSIYQPVPLLPNEDWTDDFETCVEWLRAGHRKTIGGVIASDDNPKETR